MICFNVLIVGFKQEIWVKIFGFWGYIYIIDMDINWFMFEVFFIKKDQDFYLYLDIIKGVFYCMQEFFMGKWVEWMYIIKGGIWYIQVFVIKLGIIEVGKGEDQDIEGIIFKGVGEDFDWVFMDQYIK